MYKSGCKNWVEAFNNPKNTTQLRKEYVKLAEKYHPDIIGENEEFKSITVMYSEAIRYFKIKENKINSTQTLEVRNSAGRGFDFNYILDEVVDSCRIFTSKTHICFKYIKANKKFYDNYLKSYQNLKYPNTKAEETFRLELPNVIKTFEDKDSYYIVIKKTDELVSLHDILRYYEKVGDWEDKYRHAVWIINRCYNWAALLRYNNKVLNAFNTRNLYLSPAFHTVSLLNGWQYCCEEGGKMLGTTKDIYEVMSIKTKDTKKAESYTDAESIKLIGRTLFDKGAPEEFRKFFEKASSYDIITDWKEFEAVAEKVFGKRKFIMFNLDSTDVLLKLAMT